MKLTEGRVLAVEGRVDRLGGLGSVCKTADGVLNE